MEMKKINYMLEIEILRSFSQKIWVPEGRFLNDLGALLEGPSKSAN